jgi:stage V sporulation protein S
MDLIKVSSTSRTSAVAGAIAGVVREHHRAEVQAIGAGAVNQAIKAMILATRYLEGDGIIVGCVPQFAEVTIDDKVRTAIKFTVEPTSEFGQGSERPTVNQSDKESRPY